MFLQVINCLFQLIFFPFLVFFLTLLMRKQIAGVLLNVVQKKKKKKPASNNYKNTHGIPVFIFYFFYFGILLTEISCLNVELTSFWCPSFLGSYHFIF